VIAGYCVAGVSSLRPQATPVPQDALR
jgi:hypothetical protein